MIVAVRVMMVAVILRRFRTQQFNESSALHPQQPRADRDDQQIAHDLDHPHGVAHHLGGGAEQRRGDADDRDRDQRLQHRRGERQHDAALPGLVIGDEVGRDHRLAVTRTGGVEDAVEERNAEQCHSRAAVGLSGADGARQQPVEPGLLGQNPAGHTADVGRRRCAAQPNGCACSTVHTASAAQRISTAIAKTNGAAEPARPHHGHFTLILLANCAPHAIEVFCWSAGICASRLLSWNVISRGN